MQVEILQSGRVLRHILHNGQSYIEAPESGEYEIRVTNGSPGRRLAVVSVDGVNVIDGKDAGYSGSGYVLGPWQSTTIKGFLRSGSECARFTFSAAESSYAAQTGRGTKNTGVIGVAVFDEKPKLVVFIQQPPPNIVEKHHYHPWPWGHPWPWIAPPPPINPIADPLHPFWTSSNSTSVIGATLSSASRSFSQGTETEIRTSGGLDLGTAYGRVESFHTTTVGFERATTAPALVLTLRYGVVEKLREWGVPVDQPAVVESPNPFPAAPGYVPSPPGWRG